MIYFFGCSLQIGNQIAQLGGTLVFLGGGGLFHIAGELQVHFLAMAFEKLASGFNLVEVLFAIDVADAWGGAITQVRIQAMLIIAIGRCEGPTTAEVILPANQSQGAAQSARIRKRAEIARAVVLPDAGECEARNRIVKIDL